MYPASTDLQPTKPDPVVAYRRDAFVRAGLTERQADVLAADNRVDLHFVTDRLIGRGCPPDVAFDIASFA